VHLRAFLNCFDTFSLGKVWLGLFLEREFSDGKFGDCLRFREIRGSWTEIRHILDYPESFQEAFETHRAFLFQGTLSFSICLSPTSSLRYNKLHQTKESPSNLQSSFPPPTLLGNCYNVTLFSKLPARFHRKDFY
jgi:hypothetical protein